MPPQICPNCGAVVSAGAKHCPECGSDKTTGWSDSAYAGKLGIPDENFDYDDFVREEFSEAPKPRGVSWLWWVTALVLALLLLFLFLH